MFSRSRQFKARTEHKLLAAWPSSMLHIKFKLRQQELPPCESFMFICYIQFLLKQIINCSYLEPSFFAARTRWKRLRRCCRSFLLCSVLISSDLSTTSTNNLYASVSYRVAPTRAHICLVLCTHTCLAYNALLLKIGPGHVVRSVSFEVFWLLFVLH